MSEDTGEALFLLQPLLSAPMRIILKPIGEELVVGTEIRVGVGPGKYKVIARIDDKFRKILNLLDTVKVTEGNSEPPRVKRAFWVIGDILNHELLKKRVSGLQLSIQTRKEGAEVRATLKAADEASNDGNLLATFDEFLREMKKVVIESPHTIN